MVAHQRDLVTLYARRMALTEASRRARREAQTVEDPWSTVELVQFGRQFSEEPQLPVSEEPFAAETATTTSRTTPMTNGYTFRPRCRFDFGRATIRPAEVLHSLHGNLRVASVAVVRLLAVLGELLKQKRS